MQQQGESYHCEFWSHFGLILVLTIGLDKDLILMLRKFINIFQEIRSLLGS